MSTTVEPLPHLRFEIPEAARILRISRATLYEQIREGLITTQKDGRRTFITAAELQRYVIQVAAAVRLAASRGDVGRARFRTEWRL